MFHWGANVGYFGFDFSLPVHSYTPTLMPGLDGHKITKISAAKNSAFFVSQEGKLFAWGMNSNHFCIPASQLLNTTIPVMIPLNFSVSDVVAAHLHTLLISTTGDLYACGSNEKGQLGTGDTKDRDHPVLIKSGTLSKATIKKIACGMHSSVAAVTYSCAGVNHCSNHGRCLFTDQCDCYK